MPRIFVDVEGMGMEGLRTAVEAVVASFDIALSSLVPTPSFTVCIMPFDIDPFDISSLKIWASFERFSSRTYVSKFPNWLYELVQMPLTRFGELLSTHVALS